MNSNAELLLKVEDAKNQLAKGEIITAIETLRNAFISAPTNISFAFEYGHALGQISGGEASPQKTLWRSECIEIFSNLCERLEGLTPDDRWKILRHYYLYSNKHAENRALGYEEIARGNKLGLLSVGFGCLNIAIEWIEKNSIEEAMSFAEEGRIAFEELLPLDQTKAGRYIAYSLTLAILGMESEAKSATMKAVNLGEEDQIGLNEHNTKLEHFIRMSKLSSPALVLE